MARLETAIDVELDFTSGHSIGRSQSGRELWRTPLPESLMAAWRAMRRAQLGLHIDRRCHKIAMRQERRSK